MTNSIFMTGLLLFSFAVEGPPDDPDLAKNEAMLNRIQSFHFKLKQELITEEGDILPSQEVELWKSGQQLKRKQKVLYSLTSTGGYLTYNDQEAPVYERSVNEKEAKMLSFRVRMDPYEGNYSQRVQEITIPHELYNILLIPYMDGTLSDLLKNADYDKEDSEDNQLVRFHVRKLNLPKKIAHYESNYNGCVIEVDRTKSCAITKINFSNGWEYKVDSFREFPGDIWIPSKISSGFDGDEINIIQGMIGAKTEVLECEVNEPIAEENLNLIFPDGTLVHHNDTGTRHIWKNGKPVRKANEIDDLKSAFKELVRESVKSTFGVDIARNRQTIRWVFGILIGIFFLVIFLSFYLIRKFWLRQRQKILIQKSAPVQQES